ncbi:MAG: zf-HC2 domain-containing protein [Elusimicrobiota bacterium]
MDCGKALESISAYVDAALAPVERVPLVEHLRDCAACRAEHLGLERAKAVLAEKSIRPLPEVLRARIAGMIDEAGAAEPVMPRSWSSFLLPAAPRWALAGAMAAVMLAFAATQWLPREEEPKVLLRTLLAEHVRSSRKSADIQRAILVAAPYDFIAHNQGMR